jgi:hypothetical protein
MVTDIKLVRKMPFCWHGIINAYNLKSKVYKVHYESKNNGTMSTIRKEEYALLNKALYKLEDILASIGIKEFSVSKEKHHLQVDPAGRDIDTELLNFFCRNIDEIYGSKFGQASKRSN